MQYVTRWRMYAALEDLRDNRMTVAEIAARLGYGSEAAFSRAFKRFTGDSPGAIRRGKNAPLPGAALLPDGQASNVIL